MTNGEVIRRRNLPHWDVSGAAYFLTTCLEGSIPARGLLDLEGYRAELHRRVRPPDTDERQWGDNLRKLTFARMDRWLDREPAVRYLEDPRLAGVVRGALYHFAGQRYDLLGFVVMPSHYHWVFQPLEAWVGQLGSAASERTPRQRIVQSVNSFTALACNRILRVQGTFWQHESYDHWVRDAEELERILLYVEGNPVKAGLVRSPKDWPFSSARDRVHFGLAFGEPLVKPPAPE
jgi:REP-associated tyrosine transposase